MWCRFIAYSLSHFECYGHTVHMLTQGCLLPPLTSTVKSSLFTHVHSSPLSMAASLHWFHATCYCYINNGWTFSRQTLYITEDFLWNSEHFHQQWRMLIYNEGTDFQFREMLPVAYFSCCYRGSTFCSLPTSCQSFICKYLDLISAVFWKQIS